VPEAVRGKEGRDKNFKRHGPVIPHHIIGGYVNFCGCARPQPVPKDSSLAQLPASIESRTRVIAPFLNVRRESCALEGRAHFFGDAAE